RTHTRLSELLRHEHAPLALAQRCSRVPAPTPLFSSLLNYRHSPGAAQRPSIEKATAWKGIKLLYGKDRTNYPCAVSVDDLGKGFWLTAQVESPIEPERVCEMMHTALERLVEALETGPDKALRSLDVLPEAERGLLLVKWNETERPYPQDQRIQEL